MFGIQQAKAKHIVYDPVNGSKIETVGKFGEYPVWRNGNSCAHRPFQNGTVSFVYLINAFVYEYYADDYQQIYCDKYYPRVHFMLHHECRPVRAKINTLFWITPG